MVLKAVVITLFHTIIHFSLLPQIDAILQTFMKGYKGGSKIKKMVFLNTQGVYYWAAEQQMDVSFFV